MVPHDAPTPALPQRGREEIGEARALPWAREFELPRPFGERGTREVRVVLRDAPTPVLPQRGREEFGVRVQPLAASSVSRVCKATARAACA